MAGKERLQKDEVRLLFVGSPLLDITAHCNEEVLHKYSLKSDDCILAKEEHTPLFRSLFDSPESQMVAGGSSQNTARIAKWVLKEKGDVAFAGCVGKDKFASKMSLCLHSEGVIPLYIPLENKSTGTCACLINSSGDRSMCAHLGAAELFDRHHLSVDGVRQRLAEADCVFVEGYFFGHSPNVMLALVEICSSKQVFSLSLSAEYVCREYSHRIMQVLPRVDVLLSNEAEARTLAATLGMGNHLTVEEIAIMLATKDRPSPMEPRIVIITRGADPMLLVRGTDAPRTFPVRTDIRMVDSVGCGDAIAGGFLAVYVLTGNIDEAARTGILAASEIAQVRGCSLTEKTVYPLKDENESY